MTRADPNDDFFDADFDVETLDEFDIDDAPPNTLTRCPYIDKSVADFYDYMNDEKHLKSYDTSVHAVKTHNIPKYLTIDTYSKRNEAEVFVLNKSRTWLYHITRYDSRTHKSPFPLTPHCQLQQHVDLTFAFDGDYLDLEQEFTSLIGSKPRQIVLNTDALKASLVDQVYTTSATRDYHIKPISLRVLRVQNDFPISINVGLYTSVPGSLEKKLWSSGQDVATWDTSIVNNLYTVDGQHTGMPVLNRRMMWKADPIHTSPEFARFIMVNPYILKADLRNRVMRRKEDLMEINGKKEAVYKFPCPKENIHVFDSVLFWILVTYWPVLYKEHLEFPGLSSKDFATLMTYNTEKDKETGFTGGYIRILKTVFDRLVAGFSKIMNHRDHLMNIDHMCLELKAARPPAVADKDMRRFLSIDSKSGSRFGTFKITIRLEFEKFINRGPALVDPNQQNTTSATTTGLSSANLESLAMQLINTEGSTLAAHMARALVTEQESKKKKEQQQHQQHASTTSDSSSSGARRKHRALKELDLLSN